MTQSKMQDYRDKETSTDEVQSTREHTKNPGGNEIFRTLPDRPWGPPSLLYGVSFPGTEWPGRGFDPPPLYLASRLKKT